MGYAYVQSRTKLSALFFTPTAKTKINPIIQITKSGQCYLGMEISPPLAHNQLFSISIPQNHSFRLFNNQLFNTKNHI